MNKMGTYITVVTNAMNATKLGESKQNNKQSHDTKIYVVPSRLRYVHGRGEREFTINGEEEIQRAGYDP